ADAPSCCPAAISAPPRTSDPAAAGIGVTKFCATPRIFACLPKLRALAFVSVPVRFGPPRPHGPSGGSPMIDLALQFLVSELNAYLLARTGTEFGKAETGRLVDDTGKWVTKEDQIGVSLVNVEEERITRVQTPQPAFVSGRQVILEPELRINLHVLFAANFK